MNYNLNFYTQYHQFYITDKDSPKETENSDFWTEEASHSRLAIGKDILGVGLECYGSFTGELVLLGVEKNNIDYDRYDHIVEGGLNIQSGILQVLDCPNSDVVLEIKVNPGVYRARIYSSNLDSVVGDSGSDYYRIELWPDADTRRKVLKQYRNK